jgi:quercetin dioxygenase-like cupin family protein
MLFAGGFAGQIAEPGGDQSGDGGAGVTETIQVGPLRIEFLRSKHDTDGGLDMFRFFVPPTGRMPVPHYHRDWDETVYGLEGEVTFTVAGVPHVIGPGETLYIPRGMVHGFDNRSGRDAVCLAVLTPGVLGPEYFRELADLVAEGRPGPSVIKGIMLRHGLVAVDDEEAATPSS